MHFSVRHTKFFFFFSVKCQPVGEQDDPLLIVLVIFQGLFEKINFVSTAGIPHDIAASPGLTESEDSQIVAKPIDLNRSEIPLEAIRLVGGDGKYQDI